MALIVKDRVKETTTTTGTGLVTLAGASTGFRSFADIGNANTTYYCISGGSQFEVGLGTYTASGTTLSRDTVLSNSLGTTAKIDFSAGSKDVFVTYPSDKAILGDTSAVASTGTGSVVLSASPTITGTLNAADLTTTGNTILGNASTDTLNVGNGGLVKDASGNVGIGTNNPATKLQVGTTGTGTRQQTFVSGQFGFEGAYLGAANTNGGATLELVSHTNATDSYGWKLTNDNDTATGALTFSKSAITSTYAGLSYTESMRINSSGGVSIGNTTDSGAGSLNVSGNLQLTGSATDNQNIATTQTSGTLAIGGASGTGAITLGRSTAAQTVGIATGINTSATKTVNIGTGSTGGATNINIGAASNCTIGLTGSITLAGAITTTAVSNNIDIGNSQVAGALTIGGTAQTGAITLGRSTATQTTNLQAGATASGSTKTLNIGTGGLAGSTSNIAIGSTAGTSTTTINGAVTTSATTQALDLSTSQTTGTVIVGGTSGTGAITLGQSTQTQTVNIATGVNTGTKTVNIGTGTPTGTRNITIGGGGTTEALTVISIGRQGSVGSNIVSVGAVLRQTVTQLNILQALTAVTTGTRAMINDAFTIGNLVGTTAVGGGSYISPVYFDGSNWLYG